MWARLLQNAGILNGVDVDGGCSRRKDVRLVRMRYGGISKLAGEANVDLKGPDRVGCIRLILVDRVG
jgi:hypothetical protein